MIADSGGKISTVLAQPCATARKKYITRALRAASGEGAARVDARQVGGMREDQENAGQTGCAAGKRRRGERRTGGETTLAEHARPAGQSGAGPPVDTSASPGLTARTMIFII